MIKLFLILLFVCNNSQCAYCISDKERLSRAVEYFQSGKFHESLLQFQKLDMNYRLNPRFQAYKGVCLYYDADYDEAAATFAQVLPKLDAFAPHERSVYYYCAAESNYRLKHYVKAIELYEKQFLLCYKNEKGDALFRIGQCYYKKGQTYTAQEYFAQAIAYYHIFNTTDKLQWVEKEIVKLNMP